MVVVLVFVAIFGTLSVGYIIAASANLKNAQLYLDSRRAHLAAESGLTFARQAFPGLDVRSAATAAETLQAMATALNTQYCSTLFNGQSATVEGNCLTLPAIILNFAEGPSQFRLFVAAMSDTQYTVECYGTEGACAKSLYINLKTTKDTSLISSFGVASRSRISMTGNPAITGVNNAKEGSVLSTTMTHTTAIQMVGNMTVSGDMSITNPAGSISMIGNPHIGGQMRIGVQAPTFPTVDTTPFIQYATNIVDSHTATWDNQSFENIRIKANTNPNFTGNTTIRGVVYIESPNQVTFTGNLNLIGAVVVQPPTGPLDLSANSIRFTGNTSTNGVAALPAGSQFDGLRNLTGSFLLAPGYLVEFTGNFSTINGTVLASQMKFTGNASGTIRGSVLNYDDTDFVMSGNSRLRIDHAGLSEDPTGLLFPRKLSYIPGSYDE